METRARSTRAAAIVMDRRRPEMRRTMTLSERLSKPDLAIRDFLGAPHDDAENRRPSTLMDAIGRDGGHGESGIGAIINWKPLRDRLRLRHAASAWTTMTTPAPKPAAAATNRCGDKYNYSLGEAAAAFSPAPSLRGMPSFSRATSTRVGPTFSTTSTRRTLADDEEDEDNEDNSEEEEEGREDEEEPTGKMSLMALLEQTDNQSDEDDGAPTKTSTITAACDDDDDEGEAREEEMVNVCCVCMVRHKGAAFIPCGHTFCRLCSRELWVSRGNCPLCNGFIQEILDIF